MRDGIRKFIGFRGGVANLRYEEKLALALLSEGKAKLDPNLQAKLQAYQSKGDPIGRADISALMAFAAGNLPAVKGPLYRGLRGFGGNIAGLFGGRKIQLGKTLFESWSYRSSVAAGFAENFASLGFGVVLRIPKPKPKTLVWDFVTARKADVYADRNVKLDIGEAEVILAPQCASCGLETVGILILVEPDRDNLMDLAEAATGKGWTVAYGSRGRYPAAKGMSRDELEGAVDEWADAAYGGLEATLDHARKKIVLTDY